MNEVLYAGLFLSVAVLLVRIVKGPTVVDRIIAADAAYLVLADAMALYALFGENSMLLPLAVSAVSLGFIATVFISKMLEAHKI